MTRSNWWRSGNGRTPSPPLQRILRDEPQIAGSLDRVGGDGACSSTATTSRSTRTGTSSSSSRTIRRVIAGAAEVLLKERRLEEARARAAGGGRGCRGRPRSRACSSAPAPGPHRAGEARCRRCPRTSRRWLTRPIRRFRCREFVEARILYDQGKYEEALPWFERAVAAGKDPEPTPIPDLYFYAGDTLVRLNRHAEAEALFAEELREFPQNVRARAGLATLYHATGQPDMAASAITEMLRAAPTPESYTVAARLWTSFGNFREAQSVRAEARRTFSANQ